MDISNLTSDEKRALVQQLLSAESEAPTSFALARGQQSLWVLNQLAPESPAYNFVFAGRLNGAVNQPALERAFSGLIDRHASLRTTYESTLQGPVQRVHRHVESPVAFVDAAGWSDERTMEELRREADRPVVLQSGPAIRATLYRKSADEHVLALVAHHIVADLWSMEVMIQELGILYQSELQPNGTHLPEIESTYADFVRWEHQLLSSPKAGRLWEYWRTKLSGDLPVMSLPTDRPRPAVQTYRGDAYAWPLEEQTVAAVKKLAADERATLFTTLLASFQALLSRYTGQDDVIVGTTTATRSRPEWERAVGYYLNQVALRADLSENPEFSSFLSQVRETVLGALEHQDYPFPLLVERLRPPRDPGHSPLFQVAFIWDKVNAVAGARNGRGVLDIEPLLLEQRGAPFDLTLIVFDVEGQLSPCLRYNVDLFDRGTIERMAEHFSTLLGHVARNPDCRISEIPLLNEQQRRRVLDGFNDTDRQWPDDRSVCELFEERAKLQPDAVAVEYDGQSMTYGELDRRSDRLAAILRRSGAGDGVLVGVCMPRCPETVLAIIATWKAGAAYVPLDPAYPQARLQFMIDDARPAVVISHSSVVESLPTTSAAVLLADKLNLDEAQDGEVRSRIRPEDPAYVIYTSGSTGTPKGVLVPHRGIANTAQAVFQTLGLRPGARALQFSSICFDASVWEYAGALISGATLVVPSCRDVLSGGALLDLLREKRINILTLPPSILATVPEGELPELRTIVCAGEPCGRELVAAWAPGRSFFNAYGPTETSICASMQRVTPGEESPGIGRPIANVKIYLLNESMEPVPEGTPGELYIGGPGLAIGYLNRDELTAERFVPNPFGDGDGSALYRTGDLASYQPDGELEFLGRVDHQVKVRGFRIELGEIEAALKQDPRVVQSVVAAQPDHQGGHQLIGYLVPAQGPKPNTTELRSFLRERLPEFMIPAQFVPLDSLPLTPSGKIDRQALPKVNGARPELAEPLVAPRSERERELAQLWEQVLNVEQVGVHDNFFDLGGASIQAVQVADLAAAQGCSFPPEAIFQFQTVAELAAAADTHAVVPPAVSVPETSPSPRPRQESQNDVATRPTKIESLGVYLPEKIVSSEEVVAGCRAQLEFPLERMTGIKRRRMSTEGEYSIDLARKAVEQCLDNSQYGPGHIDLLICCNISRYDGRGHRISFEPSTAVRLKREFGMTAALAFDVSNACAGFFTAIKIADDFFRSGVRRRAMVVSGEYVTHLTRTAQQEIESFMDARLACLTLGDSGAAVILEPSSDQETGFQALDLFTLGDYNSLCVAKVTDKPHGGAIMLTDAVKASAVSIQQAVRHAQDTLASCDWSPERVQHLIMHQTSETTLDGAVHELNRAYGRDIADRGNTVYNLAERGNTATTTHFVAMMDLIRSGKIASREGLGFAITGSGQTVGTALYVLDDLPDRIRRGRPDKRPQPRPAADTWVDEPSGIIVDSIGSAPPSTLADTTALLTGAGESCLGGSSVERSDIDLLLHAGVYRTDYLCEPALAAIAAGELQINSTSEASGRTLAFDVMNGAVGFLNACHVATQVMQSRQAGAALVLASEVENNSGSRRIGVEETASAVLLRRTSEFNAGFGRFFFRSFGDRIDCLESYSDFAEGRTQLQYSRAPELERDLVECLRTSVEEFLAASQSDLKDYRVILPPQISSSFIARLAGALEVDSQLMVDVTAGRQDLMTSSFAYAMDEVRRRQMANAGDKALVLSVGSGIETGCVNYWF